MSAFASRVPASRALPRRAFDAAGRVDSDRLSGTQSQSRPRPRNAPSRSSTTSVLRESGTIAASVSRTPSRPAARCICCPPLFSSRIADRSRASGLLCPGTTDAEGPRQTATRTKPSPASVWRCVARSGSFREAVAMRSGAVRLRESERARGRSRASHATRPHPGTRPARTPRAVERVRRMRTPSVVRSPRETEVARGPMIESDFGRPDSASTRTPPRAHGRPMVSAAASASSGTMRSSSVFPDPQKPTPSSRVRAFTTQVLFTPGHDDVSHRGGVFSPTSTKKARRRRLRRHARARRGGGRPRPGARRRGTRARRRLGTGTQPAQACLKVFRNEGRRTATPKVVAAVDGGGMRPIPNAKKKKGSRFSRLGSDPPPESLGETTRGAGGRARAAREHATANTTRRARPTPKPSGRPWSARWRLTMRRARRRPFRHDRATQDRARGASSINPSVIAPRPCRSPPGGRAPSDAAQTPPSRPPVRARSRCEVERLQSSVARAQCCCPQAQNRPGGRRWGESSSRATFRPAWKKSWRRATRRDAPPRWAFLASDAMNRGVTPTAPVDACRATC